MTRKSPAMGWRRARSLTTKTIYLTGQMVGLVVVLRHLARPVRIAGGQEGRGGGQLILGHRPQIQYEPPQPFQLLVENLEGVG